jgi:hypothetical protein
MSKYGNIKTTTSDGITHDSRKEANRWCELLLLQRAGKIYDLKRQVKYIKYRMEVMRLLQKI